MQKLSTITAIILVSTCSMVGYAQSRDRIADDSGNTASTTEAGASREAQLEKITNILRAFAREGCRTMADDKELTDAQAMEVINCLQGSAESEVQQRTNALNKCGDDFSHWNASRIGCTRGLGITCADNFKEAVITTRHLDRVVIIDRPGQFSLSGHGAKSKVVLVVPGINPELAIDGHSRVFKLGYGEGISAVRKITSHDLSRIGRMMTPGMKQMYAANPVATGKLIAQMDQMAPPDEEFRTSNGEGSYDESAFYCRPGFAAGRAKECVKAIHETICNKKLRTKDQLHFWQR